MLREMEKKILNSFNGLNIYDKLKKFETNLIEIKLLIESIESEKMGEKETASFIRRFIDQKKLKKIEAQINHFLRYPLLEPKTGRPIEYPDSNHEKTKFRSYRMDGLSIRRIAKIEKMSPNTVLRKLKKYSIE